MDERAPSTHTQDLFATNDYSVQVTLSGDRFDPARATGIIGLEPTKSGIKGEPRDPQSTEENAPLWETGFWSRDVHSKDDIIECRDHQLLCLIDEIAPHIDALKSIGMERIYFYYTLASSIGMMNIRLQPETMRRLAAIDADLYITCFDCFNPKHEYWNEREKAETE